MKMLSFFAAGLGLTTTMGLAQAITHSQPHSHVLASHIIVPQARAFAPTTAGTVTITEVNATVDILEQVATTTLEITLSNTTGARIEAQMVVPVPDKAALRGFAFQGAACEPTAQLLPKEEARKLYDEIVAKTRDPALLEFIGHSVVRSSIFPVEPRGGQKVRITYEHVLPADGDRIDYALPRTESIDYHVPWHITAHIKSKSPVRSDLCSRSA